MERLNNKKGFTLIEMVVVLAVIGILAAVMTPMLISYVKDAKIRRAESDVKAIGAAVLAFNKDLNKWPIWDAASGTYNVLSSTDGDAVTATDVLWTATGGTLEGQLVTNVPVYASTGKRKWMGPYLERINADPWGNNYYVNVLYLQSTYLSPGSEKAVFALSAGPNGVIDTAFMQAVTAFSATGDDIAYRIK